MNEHSKDDYSARPSAPPEVRFIADCMLGRLAKWLRILGYDTQYDREADDAEIVRIAAEQDRVILTRDNRLVERRLARRYLLIESHRLSDQLRQVVAAFELPVDGRRILSRCLPCNRPTEAVPAGSVRGLVPDYVFRTQQTFARCPGCGRIYWGATHLGSIRRAIRSMLGTAGGEAGPER